MATRFATPKDLQREPWWNQVRGRTIVEVFEACDETQQGVIPVLMSDVLDLYGVSVRASREAIEGTLGRITLGAWVERWKPIAALVQHGRIEALRKALDVLAVALERLAKPPKGVDFGPLGTMDVRVLAERRGFVSDHYIGLPTWGPAQTVNQFFASPGARAPNLEEWIRAQARDLEAAIASAGPDLEARQTRWRAAASKLPVVAGLLALRDQHAPGVVPATHAAITRTTVSWQRDADMVVVENKTLVGCMTGPCTTVELELGSNVPKARCRKGTDPCRGKLCAIERTLELLSEDPPTTSPDLVRHFAEPAWRRMLNRLRAAAETTNTPTGPSPEARFGWVLKIDPLRYDELVPSWVEPTKKGGWKAKQLTQTEQMNLELDDHGDAMALMVVRSDRAYGLDRDGLRDRLAKVLAGLAGKPVFARIDNTLVRLEVERRDPQVEVDATPAGPRVRVRWGGWTSESGGEKEPPVPGLWTYAVDEARGVLCVGLWSRAATRAWKVVERSAAVPEEATSELAEVLLGVAPNVSVKSDTIWLGTPHEPANDVVFRLGFEGPKGAKILAVEGRVFPVPELGAMLPGDGEEIVPVRRDGKVGHVVRALERERAAVLALAADIGLAIDDGAAGPALFDWKLIGLERAVAVWSALEKRAASDPSVKVAWRTAPILVQRQKRVDRLRLRLGLRKDWLDLTGGFSLDGGELPLRELLQALRDNKRFVVIDESRVLEIDEVLQKELAPLSALARATGGPTDGSAETLRASMLAAPLIAELESGGASVDGPPEWLTASQRLNEAASLEVPIPPELAPVLRPYQAEGVEWLGRLAHWARGACLADDMGLGKTLQALGFLLHRRPAGRALVVAPTSVVANWLREAARFAPNLSIAAIARGTQLGRLAEAHAVVVTSWDLLTRHEERFAAIEWATVVFDEAHAMKNAVTKRAQVAKGLPAGFVLALTGTPVENRPSELWSLFQAVAPGLLGSAESFRETFARQIELGQLEAARRLGKLVRPFLLRRRKSEVARDLPSRSEVRVDIVLSADERERYEKVRKAALAELARDAKGNLAELAGSGGRGILKILVVLTRLRQLACHPRLVEPKAPPTSSKIERLVELVAELRDEGRRVLVFSQFTELLSYVRAAFDGAGFSYTYLDGSTSPERRVSEVDRFQRGEVDAFVLSLKAGGVGLNLTAATEVIHLDPWWNPAVEDQGSDRAHRIGQDKPVTIYRMVALGTIEEQILGLHADKRAMVASMLEGTDSAKPVTVDELVALLSEEGLEAAPPDAAGPPTITVEAVPVEPPDEKPPLALPAPARSAPSSVTIERVFDLIEAASGLPLKRAEIMAATGLTDGEWNVVRAALERDARVVVEGLARGRTYRWQKAQASTPSVPTAPR